MASKDIKRLSEETKKALLGSLPEDLSTEEANKLLQETFTEVLGHGLNVKVVENRPHIDDRVEYIKSLNNIQEVRQALKSAYSKRSRAKTEEQDFRYGEEIRAANDRLDEINSEINSSDNPLERAREFGDLDENLVQRMLDKYRELDVRFDRWLKYIGMTKLQAGYYLDLIHPDYIPKEVLKDLNSIGERAQQIYLSRALRRDQRVISINKTLGFMEKYTPEYIRDHGIILRDGRGEYKKTEAIKRARKAKKGK